MSDASSSESNKSVDERLVNVLEGLEGPLKAYIKIATTDRRSAGVWTLFKRGGIVLACLMFAMMYLAAYGTVLGMHPSMIKPTVAQIEIAGAIGPGNLASADRLVPMIENLCSQENVKALVLHINSPGGAPGDAERIGAAVDNCRAWPLKGDKPVASGKRRVIAVVDGLDASAAYMISIHADEIVSNPTGLTGSIGVVFEFLRYDGLMAKVGVTSVAYSTGPLKTMLSPYSPDTPQQKVVVQGLADDAMQAFKSDVMQHRPHLKLDAPDLWSGRVWVAAQAKEIGLIDTIGLLEDTERREFPKLVVQRFEPTRNIHDALSMQSWVQAIGAEMESHVMEVR